MCCCCCFLFILLLMCLYWQCVNFLFVYKWSDPVCTTSICENLIQWAENIPNKDNDSSSSPKVARTLLICQSLKRYISVFIANLSNLSVIYHESVYFSVTREPQVGLELNLHTFFTFYYHATIGLRYIHI